MPQKRKEKRELAEKKLCEDRKVDEASRESFPASDPPSYMGGKHSVGAPMERETPRKSASSPPRKPDR